MSQGSLGHCDCQHLLTEQGIISSPSFKQIKLFITFYIMKQVTIYHVIKHEKSSLVVYKNVSVSKHN